MRMPCATCRLLMRSQLNLAESTVMRASTGGVLASLPRISLIRSTSEL
ncbi:Uncharacterised protein [Mycobacterium tuberculosis]|uniref:Uncharacterized protein n=1 Tax=Mycobacterium tuberculosis TaxID=1773 RepID=A0A0T9BXJ5_MYCTX|nr:hypothetical protein X196_03718 [Mycobacterium tuberculosis BTB11-289]CEZ95642.1 Uncharacterised protein [Mycobacterium tuberculosis]CFD80026.1 Uncharacterised protein [Mycobacterium tuberculosis]CFE43901.1 Uncharacterised protein [Mycobacterium tuberculosis]CFE62773.1 Uncharacterised protein [Mycobacterium tuberculosis]